jgi:hypothetical protein
VKEVAMTRQVRLWISAVVIMASAVLAASLTIAAHASEERSWGTRHSGQSAVNQIYTNVYLAADIGGDINQVGGGAVFSRLVG